VFSWRLGDENVPGYGKFLGKFTADEAIIYFNLEG